MRLIKAFVRREKIDDVLWNLQGAGAPGITISLVHGVGYGYERHLAGLAPNDLSKTEEVCKVEVVCHNEQVDGLIGVLVTTARTGHKGDGMAFVTPVERAIRIRTGEEGYQALERPSPPPTTA